MAEETAGRQVLRAGFLELCLPDSSILPLWVQLDALSPVQDLRPSWSEGLLSLFSDSKVNAVAHMWAGAKPPAHWQPLSCLFELRPTCSMRRASPLRTTRSLFRQPA